jgi:hypothetical protein
MKNFIEENDMAKGNKWLSSFREYEDVVDPTFDAQAKENCMFFPSPSFNWLFKTRGGGCPKGCGILLDAEQKAGKSLMCQALVQEMHQTDPEGVAIYINTERRGKYQSSFFEGIDHDRLLIRDTDQPKDIFDFLMNEIEPLLKEGMPLRIVIIDSLTKIKGRRTVDNTSIEDVQIGDSALTKQLGLDMIVPIFKKYNIVFVGTEQRRDNMEAMGNKYAPKTKSTATWNTKHTFEYFISLRRETDKDSKVDLLGNALVNDDVKDLKDNKEITGHKISFKMEQSSIGTAGRVGMLTLDYKKGIINKHEEVFLLGKNTGIIEFKAPRFYIYKDVKYNSKEEILTALNENKDLYESVLADVQARDA